MICFNLFMILFHGLKALAEHPIRNASLDFSPVLAMTALPGHMSVKTDDNLSLLSPKCQEHDLRYRTYKTSTGILTGFPFPLNLLGRRLGSTNP